VQPHSNLPIPLESQTISTGSQSAIKDKNMYAYFDSTAAQPTLVLGWIEGDTHYSATLPTADLLALTQEQWDGRLSTPFVSGGVLVAAPAQTESQMLDAAQQTQLDVINSAYDTAMQQPVAYMNTTFQADKDSQDLMNRAITGLQAIVAIGGTVPANFAWYDVNNQPITMTLLQLQGLFATGVANVNSLFVYKQTQKAAIRAATTVSGVAKIVW
jgi:hypothetical protein